MQMYSRVYLPLCQLLAISGRSRTQRNLNPREKFPIYGSLLFYEWVHIRFEMVRNSTNVWGI